MRSVMKTTNSCLPLKEHVAKNNSKLYSHRNFEVNL